MGRKKRGQNYNIKYMTRTAFISKYIDALKYLKDIKGYEMEKAFIEECIDAAVDLIEEQRRQIDGIKLNNTLLRVEAKLLEQTTDRILKGDKKEAMKMYLEILNEFENANEPQFWHDQERIERTGKP